MPSLKSIRTRIASVKNTQKITKAMKLVAAARLRRAQDQMHQARPYAGRMSDMVRDIVSKMALSPEEATHPLLAERPLNKVRLIVVGADRGLAGGFNSNLNRRTERFLVDEAERYPTIELVTVGRKPRDHFRRRKATLVKEHPGVTSETALARAREIANESTHDYLEGNVDAVFVLFNEFKSAIAQKVELVQLLPLPKIEASAEAQSNLIDFVYEPSRAELLSTLLPLYLETLLHRVMLETVASFLAAQMTAMDSATKNAKEMIGRYTLQLNRARQAAITKELMEIVSGAEALKG